MKLLSIFLSALFICLTCSAFGQFEIAGKYYFQDSYKGVVTKDAGSIEFIKTGDNEYNYILIEKGHEKNPSSKQVKLEGRKVIFPGENGVEKGEFLDDGSFFYTIQGIPAFIDYLAIATREGKPRKNISKELALMTVDTRPCPCCKKVYKKGKGYFVYADNRNVNMYQEKQDLLQKAKSRYCCSELCAENHYKVKCK